MKRIGTLSIVCCLGLLMVPSTCVAQMYTVTDLGTLGGSWSESTGINASGQVVGNSEFLDETWGSLRHIFRTSPNQVIHPILDDLNTVPCIFPGGGLNVCNATAAAINDSGQVVGSGKNMPDNDPHPFRTAANRRIANPDDIIRPFPGGGFFEGVAFSINNSGTSVGFADCCGAWGVGAFRTDASNPLIANRIGSGVAYGINDSGQVVGDSGGHAFRTSANGAIDPATDDLGTLGGSSSTARAINAFGQAVGGSLVAGDAASHAFRTAPNSRIDSVSDDLGTLGGSFSFATSVNNFGQVVGWASLAGDTVQHAFIYDGGVMHDLNSLVAGGSTCPISGVQFSGVDSPDVNDAGQIAANVLCNGEPRAIRLDPIYKAVVRPPIHADGSSVFSAKRGVIPVKFRLTQYNSSTCSLLPATIAITRAAGATLASVDNNTYSTRANRSSSQFDTAGCQYMYHLAASALGVGTYRVDISIAGIMVGHAVFALK